MTTPMRMTTRLVTMTSPVVICIWYQMFPVLVLEKLSSRKCSENTVTDAKIAPKRPWATPSNMNGTRMNQLVAPTSFITDTSRRRAKIANRMVLMMSTEADSNKMTASTTKTNCRIRLTVWMLWMVFVGTATLLIPGYLPNCLAMARASLGLSSWMRNDAGMVPTVSTCYSGG